MSKVTYKRRNIRPWLIILGIMGVASLLVDPTQLSYFDEVGFTLLAIALLLGISELIRDRLAKLGAESWALGSIIVSIGFILFSSVLIGFAWSFFDGITIIILASIGLLTMLLGFTTEYYDLNIKFLEFFNRAKIQFENITHQIRTKFLRSIWTILSLIVFVILILSYFFTEILDIVAIIVPSNILNGRIVLAFLIFIFLIVEFREFITFFFIRTSELFLILFRGMGRRIRQLRSLFVTLLVNLKLALLSTIEFFGKVISFVRINTYVIGIIGFLSFGVLSLVKDDAVLGSFAIILLLTTLSLIFVRYEERISRRLLSTQQTAYGVSFKVRNLLRRRKIIACPKCGYQIFDNAIICANCMEQLPMCMICKNIIHRGEEVDSCTQCQYFFHSDHIEKWVELAPTCPVCKERWKSA